MLKKLFITLCLLALCSTLFASGITEKLKAVVARKSEVVAGCCGAPFDVIEPGATTSSSTKGTTDTQWHAALVTPENNECIAGINMHISDNSVAGTCEMYLYAADGSHHPTGSLLASGTISSDDTPPTNENTDLLFDTPYQADNIEYTIYFVCDGSMIIWHLRESNDIGIDYIYYNGSIWTGYSDTYTWRGLGVLGCEYP